MPPRARKATPAPAETTLLDGQPPTETEATEPKQAAVKKAPPPLCEACFPAGWPEDAYSAGCEHGSYLHPERAAAIGS